MQLHFLHSLIDIVHILKALLINGMLTQTNSLFGHLCPHSKKAEFTSSIVFCFLDHLILNDHSFPLMSLI